MKIINIFKINIGDLSDCVGISIRRGDFLNWKDNLIIPLYSWFLKVSDKYFKNKKIIISSDEIQFYKQNIHNDNIIFLDQTTEINLFILSICKYHILSNSTFSWWTSYLSNYSDAITVCTNRFVKKELYHYRDNYNRKNWILQEIKNEQCEN